MMLGEGGEYFDVRNGKGSGWQESGSSSQGVPRGSGLRDLRDGVPRATGIDEFLACDRSERFDHFGPSFAELAIASGRESVRASSERVDNRGPSFAGLAVASGREPDNSSTSSRHHADSHLTLIILEQSDEFPFMKTVRKARRPESNSTFRNLIRALDEHYYFREVPKKHGFPGVRSIINRRGLR
jgi:hypothetical protein